MRLLGRVHQALIFRRRVRVLGRVLSELLPIGARVLDVECGDGSVAAAILRRRVDLTIRGLEVALRPEASIPVALFDETRIPADDSSWWTCSITRQTRSCSLRKHFEWPEPRWW